MDERMHLNAVVGVAMASLVAEMAMLSRGNPLGDTAYHALHLVLMGVLVVLQGLLWFRLRRVGGPAPAALLIGLGLVFTAVGDYVNSALSPVTPVSAKLSVAVVLFGIGYGLYTALLAGTVLVRTGERALTGGPLAVLLVVVAVINVFFWNDLSDLMAGHGFLRYGSLVFSTVLYTAFLVFAALNAYQSRWAPGSVLVLFAAFFIAYSDQILFGSWLEGNPDSPDRLLYAVNWAVYFTGQALFSALPAVLQWERPRPAGAGGSRQSVA